MVGVPRFRDREARQRIFALAVTSGVVLVTAGLEAAPTKGMASLGPGDEPVAVRCPRNMAAVVTEGRAFCIDKYEAAVVEVGERGRTAPHSPYEPVTGKKVKALSAPGIVPQGYISGLEAKAACENAGKRLCTAQEWELACRGRTHATYPYGDEEVAGRCNDQSRRRQHPVVELFNDGEGPFQSFAKMNDSRINQLPKTVSKSGSHPSCKSSFGVYDMVGNLHEWTDDPKGQFRGGYYMDTHKNGVGCSYVTTAHDVSYHDYSTGFRCCK
jgi:hypothetical protein